MLHLNNISKSFGAQRILDQASLHLRPGMRVGLVGANGAGKTTLLRLMAGELSPDEGEMTVPKGLRIGFLPQEIEEITGHTVLEEVLASHAEVLALERRIEELTGLLGSSYAEPLSGPLRSEPRKRAQTERWLKELGALQTAFENARGYELETRAQAILRGMGFKDSDFHRSIAELSGGWRMRVALARLLLEQPDLLLMDEPTNHLDLESLLWLEEFLLGWPGALVIVSHDRYFLNRLVTHIADLDRGKIDLYAGNYDRFEEEKLQRYESLLNAAKNQQREIESAEAFIRRFRAKNTKARQVQQKIRQLERLERIEVPNLGRKTIRFRFPQPPRSGRVVAEAKHVRKAYGDHVVYTDLNLVIERGEKIALVGPNGAGKSTLLKLLAGVLQPDAGVIRLGHAVRRAYYAQHQLEVLKPELTVLATMEEVAAPVGRLPEVRSFLGAFLFDEDDVGKKVTVLSGGEKARLALARMLIDPAGLLLLDEPTNHLDMDSRAVLTEALRQFEGAIVFISHDRHLINAIGTKVIEVREGNLTPYPGDWEYYTWKKAQEGPEVGAESRSPSGGSAPSAAVASPEPDFAPSGRSLCYRERKELQRRFRKVEKTILELEERQKQLAAILSDPAHMADYELLFATSEELSQVRDRLAVLNTEWEQLAEAVEALEQQA